MFPTASNLLASNKQDCTEQVIAFIRSKILANAPEFYEFPNTQEALDFCKRDTEFVINAYINDLRSGNDEYMTFVSSRYWIGSVSGLVGDRRKEVLVHEFLRDYIINIISQAETGSTEFITQECDLLIDVILNGPKRKYLHNALGGRFTAHWWSNRAVEKEKLETILECAYKAPSKNGKHEHEIMVVTNSPEGRAFKQWLYWDNSYCLNNVRAAPGEGLRRQNGQVLAPILLIWLAKGYSWGNTTNGESNFMRVNNDCMVSATMAMCAAEELGVQTGFCNCMGWQDVAQRLNKPGMLALTSIGIGYAPVLDNRHFRPVSRYGVRMGFDYSNTYPENRTYENRNRRPEKANMIHIL